MQSDRRSLAIRVVDAGGATLSECPMIQDQSIVMLDAIDKRRPTYAGSDLLDCRQRLMED